MILSDGEQLNSTVNYTEDKVMDVFNVEVVKGRWTHMSEADKRQQFIWFLIGNIMWVSIDFLFDVLFIFESYQFHQQNLPSSSPFRVFYPSMLTFLVLSSVLTIVRKLFGVQVQCAHDICTT